MPSEYSFAERHQLSSETSMSGHEAGAGQHKGIMGSGCRPVGVLCDSPETQGDAIPNPSTPDLAQDQAVTDVHVVHWLSNVYLTLEQGLERLYDLHPACRLIPQESTTLALGIFRQYVVATGFAQQYAYMQPLITNAIISVCLWSAVKFLAMPGVVPNARFMSTAVGIPSSLLLSLEPEVLNAIQWDVLGICKAIGLAPLEPLGDSQEDDCCLL
ncbi:hypothetical protein N2152v2_008135 [Parachlorella kessleri]